MLLARSLRIGFAALLALHLLGSFAAIALLGRMRPALEQILKRNVHSLEAAEEMMGVMAAPGEGASARFDDALSRAASNITEEGEQRVLEIIEHSADSAIAGDERARRVVAQELLNLAHINRAAIEKANLDAQRLGNAGAWAVALLAFTTLLTGLVALRLLDRRVLAPVSELCNVLSRAREGDTLRRCRPLDASAELADAMRTLNHVLDEARHDDVPRGDAGTGGEADRAIALHLLDMRKAPTLVIDARGATLAANKEALERLAEDGDDSLQRMLSAAAKGEQPAGMRVTPLTGDLFICALDAG